MIQLLIKLQLHLCILAFVTTTGSSLSSMACPTPYPCLQPPTTVAQKYNGGGYPSIYRGASLAHLQPPPPCVSPIHHHHQQLRGPVQRRCMGGWGVKYFLHNTIYIDLLGSQQRYQIYYAVTIICVVHADHCERNNISVH